MKPRLSIIALALAVMATTASPAFARAQQPEPTAAGRVKIASGVVFIVRAGTTIPAQAGQPVFEGDTLRTGADGRVGRHP